MKAVHGSQAAKWKKRHVFNPFFISLQKQMLPTLQRILSQQVMGGQQYARDPDFNKRDPLDVESANQLLPLFLKKQRKRAIRHQNDARPEHNGAKETHRFSS